MDNNLFNPDWICPPGETLLEILEEREWTHSKLAQLLGYSNKHVHLLLKGEASLSEEFAIALERTLGSTAEFWIMRESKYRQALARKKDKEKLKHCTGWIKKLPIKYLLEHGWIKPSKDKRSIISDCLAFFGVASVDVWNKQCENLITEFRFSSDCVVRIGFVLEKNLQKNLN